MPTPNPVEHENSIDAKLMELTPEEREKYKRNRKRHTEDQQALEEWASRGFTSGGADEAV